MQSVFNYPSQGQQASEPLNLRLSEGEATYDDEKGPSPPSDMPQFAAGAKSPMKLAASDSEDVLDSLNTALEWKGVLQMRVKTSDGMMLVRTPGTRRQASCLCNYSHTPLHSGLFSWNLPPPFFLCS